VEHSQEGRTLIYGFTVEGAEEYCRKVTLKDGFLLISTSAPSHKHFFIQRVKGERRQQSFKRINHRPISYAQQPPEETVAAQEYSKIEEVCFSDLVEKHKGA
jgi:hypothetical protein